MLLLLPLLLGACLLVTSSTAASCCGSFTPSHFTGLAPNARAKVYAAAASDDGGRGKGRGALMVVVRNQATRLYSDLYYPAAGTVSIEHPEDQRFFERHRGRGRPRHKIAMPCHFSPLKPKAGRSAYPDLVSSYFRRLEREMAGADSILVMGHGKGKGQAAEVLLKDLARTKPSIAAKVKGLVRLDDTHVSDRQILQLARHVLLGRPDPRKRRIIRGQSLQ